jgi:hypothetical protein
VALTPHQRRQLRSLLLKAELDFLCPHCGARTPIGRRLLGQGHLKKHDPGAPQKGDDAAALEGLERCVRVLVKGKRAEGERRYRRGHAILFIAQSLMNTPGLTDAQGREIADNADALARRWERKLREGGYNKRPFNTLKASGVLLPLLNSGALILS